MPAYLFGYPNTIFASLLMALWSGACMFFLTVKVNLTALAWMAKKLEKLPAPVLPWGTVLPFMLATAASMIGGYFIAVGFADRLVFEVFSRFGDDGDPLWFFIMLALPPLVHFFILLQDIVRMNSRIN